MDSSEDSVRQSKISLIIVIPPECEPYANDIKRFVNAMVYKLAKNAHKGHWKDTDIDGAFYDMMEEVKELEAAIRDKNTVEILLEAADVANFALIIASKELDGK